MRPTRFTLAISLLALIALSLAGLPASATPPSQGWEDSAGTPGTDLGLTEDQKSQIRSIREQAKEQGKALREDTSLTPEQKREQVGEIRRNAQEQISGLLTPEQRERWERRRRDRRQDCQDRREHKRDRREDRGDRRPPS